MNMPKLLEHVIRTLREARQLKGLSQRALSAKVGLSQSHISKIESGSIDPQTSNLVELARALELEVMLVPRTLVPAVQSLTRTSQAQQPAKQEGPGYKELEHIRKTASQIQNIYPRAFDAKKLQTVAEQLQRFSLDSSAVEKLRKFDESIKRAFKTIQQAQKTQAAFEELARKPNFTKALENINRTASELQRFRNVLVHTPQPTVPVSLPSYLLEKDEGDG